jgi:hypothetical protein
MFYMTKNKKAKNTNFLAFLSFFLNNLQNTKTTNTKIKADIENITAANARPYKNKSAEAKKHIRSTQIQGGFSYSGQERTRVRDWSVY